MPVLIISNGLYSNAQKIVDELSKREGYTLITDREIVEQTAEKHDIKLSTIIKVLKNKQLMFNNFTHEKEKCISCLKQTTSELLENDKLLIHGFFGHLIPKSVSQIIRILIITDKESRIKNGIDIHGSSRKEALKAINDFDRQTIQLSKEIIGKSAFSESLYDIVIPTDKLSTEDAVKLIKDNSTFSSSIDKKLKDKAIKDFQLAAKVEVQLTQLGSKLEVEADDGNILVTIDKSVLMLAKFKQKIAEIVQKVQGVKDVQTKLGRNYYSSNIVRRLDVDTPSRLLLVDDEKEFVQTLSSRLKLREYSSDIAYNGEEALRITENDNTEVMILDLKMPGIDGFEVLRKIKETKPHIEVIILTGHGSEEDRKKCMELGAFAYLEKPADIDQLTDTMKKAYDKIKSQK